MLLRSILAVVAAVLVGLIVFILASTSSTTESVSEQFQPLTELDLAATPSLAPNSASVAGSGAPSVDAAEEARKLRASGANLLGATVNILCVTKVGSSIQSISGSGVIFDSRGLIFTAAHIGQYFLLRDYPKPNSVICTVRTGSPARPSYIAELVYVSPSWIKGNRNILSDPDPKGTGQHDFAILAITKGANASPLPQSFPAVPLAARDLSVGEQVAISAYPAQYIADTDVRSDLYPLIVFNAVSKQLTFGNNTVDVVTVNATPAAQEGSSGGGIANADGGLAGIITTSSVAGLVADNTLYAITAHHLRASFAADSSASLDTYLSSNSLPTLVSNFTAQAEILRNILVGDLEEN